VGGAKVSTKIDLLENLVTKVDALVIGGGMANTFVHATGLGIGKSLAEKDLAATAMRIIEKARTSNCAIILPVDGVCAYEFKAGAFHHTYGIDAIPDEGVAWVNKGQLAATFLYATPGAEGVRQGLKLMAGEKIQKKIILPTMTIDKTNAERILKDNGLI